MTKDEIMTIAGYVGTSTNVVIPETINGYSVTTIADFAFSNCKNLISIEIPGSVMDIGEYAFSGCRSLTIYCEATTKPSGWDIYWNRLYSYSKDTIPVVWDCKNNDVAEDSNIYYIADNGIRYALKHGVATIVKQSESIGGEVVIPSEVTYNGKTYKSNEHRVLCIL